MRFLLPSADSDTAAAGQHLIRRLRRHLPLGGEGFFVVPLRGGIKVLASRGGWAMPIPTAVVPNNCAEILRLRRRDEHRSSAFLVPPLAAIGNNPSVSFADSSLYTKEPLFLLPPCGGGLRYACGGGASGTPPPTMGHGVRRLHACMYACPVLPMSVLAIASTDNS